MKRIVPTQKNNVHDYPGQRQPVVAVHPDGKLAGMFDSIKVAVDKYGFSRDGITRCCRGRQRLCGGLNWFYERDYKQLFFSGDAEVLKVPLCDGRNADGTFCNGHKVGKGRKRKMTPEYLENRRKNMRRQWEAGLLKVDPSKAWKPVVEMETGHVYPSIGHAAKQIGVSRSVMQWLVKTHRKSRKSGYRYFLKSIYDKIPNII